MRLDLLIRSVHIAYDTYDTYIKIFYDMHQTRSLLLLKKKKKAHTNTEYVYVAFDWFLISNITRLLKNWPVILFFFVRTSLVAIGDKAGRKNQQTISYYRGVSTVVKAGREFAKSQENHVTRIDV